MPAAPARQSNAANIRNRIATEASFPFLSTRLEVIRAQQGRAGRCLPALPVGCGSPARPLWRVQSGPGATDPAAAALAGRFRRNSDKTAGSAGDGLCIAPGPVGTAALGSAQCCVPCRAANRQFGGTSQNRKNENLLQMLQTEVSCRALAAPSSGRHL